MGGIKTFVKKMFLEFENKNLWSLDLREEEEVESLLKNLAAWTFVLKDIVQ